VNIHNMKIHLTQADKVDLLILLEMSIVFLFNRFVVKITFKSILDVKSVIKN